MLLIEDYRRRFEGYRSLMSFRVREILIVSTLYDVFVLEEDGSLGEQIWDQYVEFGLSYVPNVRRVATAEKALKIIQEEAIDLVLTMTSIGDTTPVAFAEQVAAIKPGLRVILLASDPQALAKLPPLHEQSAIDRVFLWNNDPLLFLAIIKYVEDKVNAPHDTEVGQVRVILLVEDSVQYYSSFLPTMYKVIWELTRNLIDDGLNASHKQLRMRSRAKVLLAGSYEEGLALYRRYRNNLLGVISDVRFYKGRELTDDAGFQFVHALKEDNPDLPICLQSAEPEKNRTRAVNLNAAFIDKNSSSLLSELRSFLKDYLGFGDFLFRRPNGQVVGRAGNVDEMLERIRKAPLDSILYHAGRQDFSHWMAARTEMTIADQLAPKRLGDFPNPEDVRGFLVNVIEQVLGEKRGDVISHYSPSRIYYQADFYRLGQGSLGGKGRGIAFARYLLRQLNLAKRYPDLPVRVPPTLVLCSDEFERFVEQHELSAFCMECPDKERIIREFQKRPIREDLVEILRAYIEQVTDPVAVRSSSLLEDSHHLPLAGMFATVMLPNSDPDPRKRLDDLLNAIRLVWASTYGPDPKSYFRASHHRIEDERMAVVIQRIGGHRYGAHFYPNFSGVAQSVNFYPVSYIRPEDGIAHVALGLGKMVVDGGHVLRFCPRYPQILPQYPTPKDWLVHSQRTFFALSLAPDAFRPDDPTSTLDLLDLSKAEEHGTLAELASVYRSEDDMVVDSLFYDGPRLLTFARILKYKRLPLTELLSDLLSACHEAMGCPAEIEFSVSYEPNMTRPTLWLLQLRPLGARRQAEHVDVTPEEQEAAICYTPIAHGNGVIREIRDIVVVKRHTFHKSETREIAHEIGLLNSKLVESNRPYLLIGFGRWGSTDSLMGIGVNWSQISGVRVLVEAGLSDFNVDLAQGTHFFQNISSLGIACLSIPHLHPSARLDWDWIEGLEAEEELKRVSHIRLQRPMEIRIDGRTSQAVILESPLSLDLSDSGVL